MDDFERNEAERRKFLNSARLKKVDRFLTQSGMRKEQVRLDPIKNQNKTVFLGGERNGACL